MQRDTSGNLCYNFELLKIAITTLAKIRIDHFDQKRLLDLTEDGFFSEFLQDPVVQVYLSEGSDSIKKICQRFCDQILETSYSTAHSAPNRKNLTIRELKTIHLNNLKDRWVAVLNSPAQGTPEGDKEIRKAIEELE